MNTSPDTSSFFASCVKQPFCQIRLHTDAHLRMQLRRLPKRLSASRGMGGSYNCDVHSSASSPVAFVYALTNRGGVGVSQSLHLPGHCPISLHIREAQSGTLILGLRSFASSTAPLSQLAETGMARQRRSSSPLSCCKTQHSKTTERLRLNTTTCLRPEFVCT